ALKFVVGARGVARRKGVAEVVNLTVQLFQFGLARSELGLEFGGSLFAFGGISDGPANVDDANLARRGWGSSGRGGRRLSTDRSGDQKTGGGAGSRVLHDSGIHFILLIIATIRKAGTIRIEASSTSKLLTAP